MLICLRLYLGVNCLILLSYCFIFVLSLFNSSIIPSIILLSKFYYFFKLIFILFFSIFIDLCFVGCWCLFKTDLFSNIVFHLVDFKGDYLCLTLSFVHSKHFLLVSVDIQTIVTIFYYSELSAPKVVYVDFCSTFFFYGFEIFSFRYIYCHTNSLSSFSTTPFFLTMKYF